LDQNLAEIRDIFKTAQETLAQQRLIVTPPERQNVYSPGDFVLYKVPHRNTKLSAEFLGPYEVLDQHKNDVSCKHLATHLTKTFHTDDIHIFIGTKETAMESALRDFDQHVIHRIITFTGDPYKRSTTSFQVEFADGDIIWKQYDKDLADTIQFEDFCRSHRFLWPLLLTQEQANTRNREIIYSPISFNNNDTIYVNLYAWTATNYHANTLPDKYITSYFVQGLCSHKKVNTREPKIRLTFPVFNTHFEVNNSFIFSYCSTHLPANATLITPELLLQHPNLP